ncbi:MAG: hypothetical protein CMF49_06600 [Legionellales bacterium]|nr:hypothetical protein [Legionellales bacterium]
MSYLLSPEIWISLFTLTLLEVILGIDNLIFLTIASQRLPLHQQKKARQLGLMFAVITRILLLLFIFLLTGLTKPLFHLFSHDFSLRDLILILGGLFLLVKGTQEIHHGIADQEQKDAKLLGGQKSKFTLVIIQIMILDIIFSLDSVITAVGMTRHIGVMICAIVIAMLAMLFASEALSRLINHFVSLKVLALSFLLMVGLVLVADGFGFHIPRSYVYFAMLFSLTVEVLAIFSTHTQKSAKNNND